jgi:pimeloyl-ACP methyl ester carboxylesterase
VNTSRRILTLAIAGLLLGATNVALAETTATSHTVNVNGIELYYETLGEGDPLVLLHSGTQTGRMFEPFVEDLAARYRLIVPDLRGHGRSTNPAGEWSTRMFARDVFALLDHLGVERFRAIGASVGAMTLLHMATQQPQRVEAMVVVGVGTWLPAECRSILGQTDLDAYPEAAWERLREKHVHGDAQIRALFGWIASLADSYNDMTFTPAFLSTITARTLVVHGDRDYCFPASMAWDIYDAIPESYLWVVPNGDHVPIRGPRSAAFTETAIQFLEGAWERR